MKKELAELIEQKYNVYVDAETEQYNYNGYNETYGWDAIPKKWIETI